MSATGCCKALIGACICCICMPMPGIAAAMALMPSQAPMAPATAPMGTATGTHCGVA